MKRCALSVLAVCLPMLGQEIKLPASFDKLAAKAKESVQVDLDGSMLQLAAKFLSNDKPDEVQAKKLVSGLKAIQVRSYEFANAGEYSQADLDEIRSQLRAPGWSRIVGVSEKSGDGGETVDVFVKIEGNVSSGIAVLAAEPKELTFVHILGTIDLEQLSRLGGHFGIPDLDLPVIKSPKK
jgi:hypothetical protein